MNVTYRIDKDILYIAIEGRIDASNAVQAEEKIFAIKNDNPGKHTVIDADNLEPPYSYKPLRTSADCIGRSNVA